MTLWVQLSKQKDFDIGVILLFDAVQYGTEHLCIVENDGVALREVRNDILKGLVLNLPRFSVPYHQTRLVSELRGVLCYQFLWKIKAELRKFH